MIGFKMSGKGSEGGAYYVNSAGLDDYYIADELGKRLEPVGTWYDPHNTLPNGKAGIIQTGEQVTKEDFRMLCRGRSPDGEALTGSLDDEHNAVFDMTFNAPKSLSVIWGLALKENPELAEKISEIHRRAATKSIEFIAEKYLVVRTGGSGGKGYKYEHVKAAGVFWPHSSSRAGDMHLHEHYTQFNLALCKDGKYRTLEVDPIYKNQLAPAAIYHTELAALLSDELGLRCEIPEDSSVFEVVGVPEDVLKNFSKEGSLINEYLSETGQMDASKSQRDYVANIVRKDKEEITREELAQRWVNELNELGYEFGNLEKNTFINFQRDKELTAEQIEKFSEISSKILTSTQSVFTEAQVYNSVSLISQGRLDADQLRTVVDHLCEEKLEFLAESENKRFYTTEEMMRVEQDMIDYAGTINPKHILDKELIEEKLKNTTLSDEQKNAVIFACGNASAVSCVEGTAGAGKSYTMGIIRELYEEAGYIPEGVALSWSAAGVLTKEAKIEYTRAIEGFCRDIENGKVKLTDKSVLFIDEAGLVGSRHMKIMLEAGMKSGAKIINAGDTLQINPLAAGAAMSDIVDEYGSARINEVRRQGSHVRDNPEKYAEYQPQRDAVLKFANGDAGFGLDLYDSMGKLHIAETQKEAINKLVADYITDREQNPDLKNNQLIIAQDNKSVRDINEQIRDYLKSTGEIEKEGCIIKTTDGSKKGRDTEFCIGDKIVFRQNDKELGIKGDPTKEEAKGVFNRTVGFIEDRYLNSENQPMLKIRLESGGYVDINCSPDGYWNKDKNGCPIQHAYATTMYASQGMTVRYTYMLDSTSLNRRLAYVGASRHQAELKIYSNKEALHSKAMSRVSDDQYVSIHSFSRDDCKNEMKRNWSRQEEKTTTRQFFQAMEKGEIPKTKAYEKYQNYRAEKAEKMAKSADHVADRTAQRRAEEVEKKPEAKIVHLKDFKKEAADMQHKTNQYEELKQLTAEAKKIDLPAFMRSEGFKVEKESTCYKLKFDGDTHPYLMFKGREGNWIAQNTEDSKVYDAIGLVQEYKKCDFKEAVSHITGTEIKPTAERDQIKPRRDKVELRPTDLAARHKALEYVAERGISKQTLQEAHKQGFARSDVYGVAFVGYDKAGNARCAETRCIEAVQAPNGNWTSKLSAPGTDKTFSPILHGENPRDVHIVEGGFDALALHDLYRAENRPTPTVITSLGARVNKFVDSPRVQEVLNNAGSVRIWREKEKNSETQEKTNAAHDKQKAVVESYLKEHNPKVKEVQIVDTPKGHKDLAEFNKVRKEAQQQTESAPAQTKAPVKEQTEQKAEVAKPTEQPVDEKKVEQKSAPAPAPKMPPPEEDYYQYRPR